MTRINENNHSLFANQNHDCDKPVSRHPQIKSLINQIKSKQEDILDFDFSMKKVNNKPKSTLDKDWCSTGQYIDTKITGCTGKCRATSPYLCPKPPQPPPQPKPQPQPKPKKYGKG